MTEEQVQASLEAEATSGEVEAPSGVEAAETEQLEAREASETSTPESEPESAPTDLEQSLSEFEAKIRAEYDGPGGKVAKVQSARDKEVWELRQALNQQSQARFEQAQQIAAHNPQQAIEMMQGEWQSIQQAQQIEANHRNWESYFGQRLEAQGLEQDDPEVQALLNERLPQFTQQSVLDPVQAAPMGFALQDALTDLAHKKAIAREKQAFKEGETSGKEEAMSKIEEMFEARDAQLREEFGIAPDTGNGSAAPATDEAPDYTKMSQAELDVAAREQRERELAALTGG